MTPRIEIIPEKKLIGKRLRMSLAENKTAELWRNFMPRRGEIMNTVSSDLFSVQIYEPDYFEFFNPNTFFEKWATLEVANFDNIPSEMKSFTLQSGLYAVFTHKGHGIEIFDYIFRTWIPNSEYLLDHRPHFEILGANYNQNDPNNSEEEIWIPIRKRC